jgi:hypothetical protein
LLNKAQINTYISIYNKWLYLIYFYRDEEGDECGSVQQQQAKQATENQQNLATGSNPFLDVPNAATAIEYKKGYVMRKSCIDPNGKKSKLFCD